MPARATVNGEMEEEPLVKNTLKIFSKTQSEIAHDQIRQDGRSKIASEAEKNGLLPSRTFLCKIEKIFRIDNFKF